MMLKRYSSLIGALAALIIAGAAIADSKVPNDDPIDFPTANCDLTGYKAASFPVQDSIPIPDRASSTAPPGQLLLGPLQFPPENGTILDVVLEVDINHSWVGDLIVELIYDSDCNGSADAVSRVLCRPRGTSTTQPAPCGTSTTAFGCSGNLNSNNVYRWTDATAAELATGACPSLLPSGCYKPTVAGGTPLGAFNGMPKNGCWYLFVSDNAAADRGAIYGWTVYLLNEVTASTPASWGRLKAIYR